MKKALAFILASFLFASVLFKSIPTNASDYAIPNSGWLPVIYDIFYSLANGNELNLVEIAGDLTGINGIIEKYNQYRSSEFRSPFEGLLNTSLFAYGLSIPESDLYDLAAQYSMYLKDGTYPVLGKWDKRHTALWNQLNTQFNDHYISLFDIGDEPIEVNPDSYYLPYINKINSNSGTGLDFFWSDLYPDTINGVSFVKADSYSWLNYFSNRSLHMIGSAYTLYRDILKSDIITINIVSDGNYYDVFMSGYTDTYANNQFVVFKPSQYAITDRTIFNPSSITWSNGEIYSNVQLETAFIFLEKNFRNVNIFVNNVPWSVVSDIRANPLINAPDVIRNNDGFIESSDVIVPDQELAFDLIGLVNLLKDKYENNESITFDDLITDGIILNPDGTALDDARSHILDMTIQRVIADEQERDDPEPIPTTTPPPYPTFPEVDWRKNPIPQPLPTGFDTSNGNPADAFSGASTLAQIVDATNRGLPSELVYTFWGIVFGMIVLGIIKVLHK